MGNLIINIIFSSHSWVLERNVEEDKDVRENLEKVFKEEIVLMDDVVSLFDIGLPQGIHWKIYDTHMKPVLLDVECPYELVIIASAPDIYRLIQWEAQERDYFNEIAKSR